MNTLRCQQDWSMERALCTKLAHYLHQNDAVQCSRMNHRIQHFKFPGDTTEMFGNWWGFEDTNYAVWKTILYFVETEAEKIVL